MALIGDARRDGAHFRAMPVVGCAQATKRRSMGTRGALSGSTTMPVESVGRMR